ncbi:hypothetical protein NUU61_009346, partial [Penicillium alfredii]
MVPRILANRNIAINGDSPMKAIATFLSSAIVTKLGYYQPFLIVGSILAIIGGGLIYTMDLTTDLGRMIGYQILYGAGIGIAVQIPIVVAGPLSSTEDQPITIAT